MNDKHPLALRFSDALASLIRPICIARHMLPEEERNAVVEGLVRIYERINPPLDDQNSDGTTLLPLEEVLTIGEMTQTLAQDIALVLQDWYQDDATRANMVVRLSKAKKAFQLVVDEMRAESQRSI